MTERLSNDSVLVSPQSKEVTKTRRVTNSSSGSGRTKKILMRHYYEDAPNSAPAVIVHKRRTNCNHNKMLTMVAQPTVYEPEEEEDDEASCDTAPIHHTLLGDIHPSAKKRSWTPKRIIDAQTYHDEEKARQVQHLINECIQEDNNNNNNLLSTPHQSTTDCIVNAETETCRLNGSEGENVETTDTPVRRTWKVKRIIDAETYRMENPDSIPPPMNDDLKEFHEATIDFTIQVNNNKCPDHDGQKNKVTTRRKNKQIFYDLEVNESNHSTISVDSAASDGLAGRYQSLRYRNASKLLSKTTHGSTVIQSFGKTKKNYSEHCTTTKYVTTNDEDDITAASTRSTRSSGSQEDQHHSLTVNRTHQRKVSDEIPLESFHCDDGHDYNDDTIVCTATANHVSNDDKFATADHKQKTWKVKRIIDAETYQRQQKSREIFRQNLEKFNKPDLETPALSFTLHGMISPKQSVKSTTTSPSSAMTSDASPLATQNLKNGSYERIEVSCFQKDPTMVQTPPLVEKASLSLKDKIDMFSQHQTQPPSFLSAKHMKKLVPIKKEKQQSAMNNTAKDQTSLTKPPLSPKKNKNKHMATKAAIKRGLSIEQPTIKDLLPPPNKSLDVKKEEEQERKKVQRANSCRRGRLRKQKSALLNQKSTQKKSVFVPISAKPEEDLSTFTLPVFSKDLESVELIKAALRHNFVFDMDDDEMDSFVNAFEQVTVASGEVIIKQGDVGDYFYIVAYGSVGCFVNGKRVNSIGQGKAFGEMALLYTCPRAATVVAEYPSTRLFRVDQKSFRFVMRNHTRESEKMKEKLLRGIPFLKHLGEEDLHRLSSVMTPCLFETGDYIVKFGEQGDSCYVIQDGKVRVTDIVVGNISYEDVNLGAGDYFGEGALISTEPRAASVVAMTKGTAFAIDRAIFRKVLGDFVELVAKSQDRHKLEGIKVFRDSNLTAKNFDTLVSLLKDKNFRAERIIFKEGKPVDSALYLVRKGTIQITTLDGSRTEEIVPGGYFGQEQLLADAQGKHKLAKYTATAGKEGCVCGVLTLKDCRPVFNTKNMEEGLHAGGSVYRRMKRASMIGSMDLGLCLTDLKRERMLGEGEFAQVWLVSRSSNGTRQEYALKVPHLCASSDDAEEALEAFRRESMVLQQLHHPFIVDLHQTFVKEDGSMDIMLEVVNGGELWNRIHREGSDGDWESGMTEHEAKFYAFCLADALAYIHREQFVFRDLKPENILLDSTGYPKLVDFGFSKYCPDITFTFCGTPNYLAPEIVRNHGHGAGVDHWSLGVVVYEMVTGENPFYFEDMDQIALFESIVTEDFYPLPESFNPDMKAFISELLEKDPVQRLGSLAGRESDILHHKWFEDFDLEMLRKKEIRAPWIPHEAK
ncbi:serine/threonine protein kinase [Nitzschia inconspicua]|uniref:Serine/threonine protein kinase n=1 Tax=Nitzschia inconspicua TaxID=303405 RepID=A0A9K3KUN8_9STRA|nr:serine/threonine protein kinase [Nitzschia inconspicua]